MNFDTLLDNIITAIAANSALNSWCFNTYTKTVTVYKGIDQFNPPPESDYPIVHVYPARKDEGYELENKAYNVGVTCGIKESTEANSNDADPAVTTVTVDNRIVNKKTYAGVARIEAMRILVFSALEGADMSNMFISQCESTYETIAAFPEFFVDMQLRIEHPLSQGDDVFD